MDLLVLGFLLASGKFILMLKFLPMRKLLWWDKWIDLFFTIVVPLALHGTFSGMIVAIFSGLFLSFYLLIARKIIGAQAPNWWIHRNPGS